MNQSESIVDIFRPWYDCQCKIDIKFLNYSGNVYWVKTIANVSFLEEYFFRFLKMKNMPW